MNKNALEDEARLIHLARLVEGENNRPHCLRVHHEFTGAELHPFLLWFPLQILCADQFVPIGQVELDVHWQRPFVAISTEFDHECDLIRRVGGERTCSEFSLHIDPG